MATCSPKIVPDALVSVLSRWHGWKLSRAMVNGDSFDVSYERASGLAMVNGDSFNVSYERPSGLER